MKCELLVFYKADFIGLGAFCTDRCIARIWGLAANGRPLLVIFAFLAGPFVPTNASPVL